MSDTTVENHQAMLDDVALAWQEYNKNRKNSNTIYNLNITSYMGERMGAMLAELARVTSELAAARDEIAQSHEHIEALKRLLDEAEENYESDRLDWKSRDGE